MEGKGSTGSGGSGGRAGSEGRKRRRDSSEESSSNKKLKDDNVVGEEEEEEVQVQQAEEVAVEEEEVEVEPAEEDDVVVGGVIGDTQTVMASNIMSEFNASMGDLTDDPLTVTLTKAKATELLRRGALNSDITRYVLAESTETWIPVYLEGRRTNYHPTAMLYQVYGRDDRWDDWLNNLDLNDETYIVFRKREGNMISVVVRGPD